MHELMHGLGPHNITVGGRATTVRQELKDTYSAHRGSQGRHLRPVRAAVPGRQAASSTGRSSDTMYTTFLASVFRSIRFGINEAHGRGVAIQLNYLLDHGGVSRRTGRHVRRRTAERIQQNVVDADARNHDAAGGGRTTRRPSDDRRSSASCGRRCRPCSTG